jgi:predicted permease
VARELEEELSFHFEESVRRLQAEGMEEQTARAEAMRRFGDEESYRRALTRIDGGRVRKGERSEIMEILRGNLSFAVRAVRRSPAFALAIVVILALGIGANAVMFGVVDRLLLSPPQHVVDADAVRHIYVDREIFNGERRASRTLTYADYTDLQSVGAFSRVAAYTISQPVTAGRGAEAERVRMSMASASLFSLLGVVPAAGRFFGEDQEALDANPTAVLSHEYWERAFGADPSAMGRTLEIGNGRYEIVGVAPAGFTGAELAPVDVWLPLLRAQQIETGGTMWVEHRNWWWLSAVGRLAEDATPEVADAAATAAHRAGREAMIFEGEYDPEARLIAAPIIAARGPNAGAETQVARWLAGVSLIVLLVACFNVANLLLARATRRGREMAVRAALGGSRARILGALLSESLLLALLGAVGGLLVLRWGGKAVHDVLLPDVAFTDSGLSGRLLLFIAVTTLVTALLAGLIPALQASRADVAQSLKVGSPGSSGGGSRTRATLLVAQTTLSVVLLVGAGLFVRSLQGARDTDLGFDADQVIVVSLQWSETLPADVRMGIYRDARDRALRLPGVESAGLTYTVPFYSSISIGTPRIPGLDSVPRHSMGGPYANKVSQGYFEAMGLAVLEGRALQASDEAENAPPVAVISESMAGAYWPAASAVGECMIFGDEDGAPCTTVVGVVENHRREALVEGDPHFLFYLNEGHPAYQGPPQALMVRTNGDAHQLVELVQREARSTSPQIRFAQAQVLEDLLAPQLRSWTLGAAMFSLFGLLALVVAGIGLYSVLAFEVTLRHHELGVRSALGAGVSRLVAMVARRAVGLVLLGMTLGLVIALATSRFVEPLLYQVSSRSPLVYGTVAAALLAVTLTAGVLPAWRATRVDPKVALRAE